MPIKLASRIASAYLRTNPLPVEQIPALVSGIHAALLAAIAEPQAKTEAAAPAVPVRKSVRHDAVVCLVCGKEGQSLKRHLATAHGLTPAQYREQFGLPADHPMVAPGYAERRSQLAKDAGLGRKPKAEESGPDNGVKPGFQYPASRWAKPQG